MRLYFWPADWGYLDSAKDIALRTWMTGDEFADFRKMNSANGIKLAQFVGITYLAVRLTMAVFVCNVDVKFDRTS